MMFDTTLVSNSILCNIAHSVSVAYGREPLQFAAPGASAARGIVRQSLFQCFNSRKRRPATSETERRFCSEDWQ